MAEGEWRHIKCDGLVVWDLAGGFCTSCHEENLEPDDCYQCNACQKAGK